MLVFLGMEVHLKGWVGSEWAELSQEQHGLRHRELTRGMGRGRGKESCLRGVPAECRDPVARAWALSGRL